MARLLSTLLVLLSVGSGVRRVISGTVPEHVFFTQRSEVYTTQSVWVMGFTIDLGSYGTFLEEVRANINLSDWLVGKAIKAAERPDIDEVYQKLFRNQQIDLKNIRDGYNFCMSRYNEVHHLSNGITRRRRSLLPFVGKLLGGLFGVITEEQLEVVKGQVRSLVEQQADIVHAIEDSVSVLNITRVELNENRHAINTVVEVTRELRSRLEGATDQIVNNLLPFKQFVLTYFQIQLQLGELRDSLHRATTYIMRIEMKLNQLSLGHLSPTILPPFELQTMLLAVREKIPPRFMLPGDPAKGLWYFYRTLHCSAVVYDDKLIVLVSLPLLDSKGKFEVYKVMCTWICQCLTCQLT